MKPTMTSVIKDIHDINGKLHFLKGSAAARDRADDLLL